MFGFNKKNTLTARAEEQERFDKLQERLEPLKEERRKSEIILKEIYRHHGISICWPDSSITIDTGYLEDEVIDDLCLFNEEERKSLHKWAKAYKDCEQLSIKMLEEYKKEEDEHRINDNM